MSVDNTGRNMEDKDCFVSTQTQHETVTKSRETTGRVHDSETDTHTHTHTHIHRHTH